MNVTDHVASTSEIEMRKMEEANLKQEQDAC